jgi:hypothetical protein
MRVAAALLVAFFAVSAKAQEPPPKPETLLDHFFCHKVTHKFDDPPEVILRDQFHPLETKKVTVGERWLLCNPVEKTHNGHTFERKHENAHLVCYRIPREPTDRTVTIENQMHERPRQLHVDKAYLLCLPSGKSETDERPTIPRGLDHFKCYTPQLTSGALNIPVTLLDQFITEPKQFTAISIALLCNPVEKTVVERPDEPGQGPTAMRGDKLGESGKMSPDDLIKRPHLVCYELTPIVNFTKTVRIANQFELAESDPIVATGTELLCVPTTKHH